MSAIFDRLVQLFEQGHAQDVGPLISDARFADLDRTADAAVLIAVTERENPTVLLTQRPRTMRDHPGQVAFPGGKLDEGEDAVEAALREAWEELAIPREHVRLIGTTDRYQTGTGFDITPVLAVVPHDLPIRPDPREVESWFECPLDKLMDASQWDRNEVFWKGAMREYLEMDHEGYRIWGVTAAICWNLSRRIAWLDRSHG
ncbi:CoA pyrophosphatase [Qipengyuania sp. XHP0211]|uniref:CoA pyrophosphatase n=1 Tax=Qipengyuania sp. XHP0211 TaxID=3038079 RepID=UPI00241FBF15|nr:CoA pyrophosphatase [Qipengyuania sp. XHP0211]MDG5749871.1 CoA pyrophosphatase [Qipengyuania sp. XHP0211]